MPPTFISPDTSRFWCPWCEAVVTDQAAYQHAYEHMDVAPYAVDVVDTFVPAPIAAHVLAEGVRL